MILAGKATLHELRTVYCLNDLVDFHEALDIEIELHERARKQNEREAEKKRSR